MFIILPQGSISSTFIEQLLRAQIPKVPTRQVVSLFSLLGSAYSKAAHRTLMKLTASAKFINVLFKKFFVQIYPKSQNVNREKLPK